MSYHVRLHVGTEIQASSSIIVENKYEMVYSTDDKRRRMFTMEDECPQELEDAPIEGVLR